MLNFAAVIPHSPILIPTIGKENTKKLAATLNAIKKLEEDFYASEIDTLIIIASDDTINTKSFIINFSPTYGGNFGEFGDFSFKPTYSGDNALADEIKETMSKQQEPVKLMTVEELNYRALIPLYFLCAHKKDLKILALNPAELTYEEHFNFGKNLCETILNSEKRIAVVSSINTSTQLSKNFPNGYSPKAKKFDQKIIDLIKEKKYKEISEINLEQAEKSGFSEIKPLLILLGILSKINHKIDILSYEWPFGVGNLTVEFEF